MASGELIPVRIGDIEIDVEAVQVAGTEATSGRTAKVAGMTAEAYTRAQDVIVEVARTTAQMIDRAAERAARPDWLEVQFGLRFAASGGVMRSRVLQLTGSVLVQARQREAARIALDRCLADAQASGGVLDAASAIITQCWLLLGERRFDQVRLLATEWADWVEPRMSTATRAELSVWGWLLLRGSAAAIRDNRPDEADELIRFASAAAAVIGPERGSYHSYWTTFGPATVAMKRVENAVVDGKPGLALSLTAGVPAGLRPTSDNRNRHLLDVTAAHLDLRQHAAAIEVLHQLSAEAPAWLSRQPMASTLLARLIARRRVLTPQMRDLAETMRLPL